MKKWLLAVTLLTGVVGAKAQSIELIPKAGINLANQSIKGLSNEKAKLGIQGGIGVNIATGPGHLSVQPELNFVTKGTRVKMLDKKEKLNLSYLEIPVLAKYNFGLVYVNAGPSIGLLINQNKNAKAAYGDLKKIDFGIQMGGGLAIPAGSGRLIVDARYALGLSNVSDVKGASIKNNGVMLSVGYGIPL